MGLVINVLVVARRGSNESVYCNKNSSHGIIINRSFVMDSFDSLFELVL